MRTTGLLALAFTVALLTACGGQGQPQPLADVVITSPQANQEFVAGSSILVEGSVVDGAGIEVEIGGGAPVSATLDAASAGRRTWSAELTAPAIGSHAITATATGLEGGPKTASVVVKTTAVRASGRWDGEFEVYDGPAPREKITGGSMVVFYSNNWFRMYFGANPVYGTTDNWDLIDSDGFRIKGTYRAAGETNRYGNVLGEPWVEYDAVLPGGQIIEGYATQGD